MSEPSPAPILVEVTRGAIVESRHRGAAAVCDAAGRIVMAWGDIERPVYARSALKPLQALPLVESGAAQRWGLGATELALACGSHHGEAPHVAAVGGWLARIGLGVGDLECGVHPPIDHEAAAALIRSGAAASALHNNCSGKHSGFLATLAHLGEPTHGYVAPDHPAQRRVLATVAAMTGLDLSRAPRGTDGCGIPVVALPLSGLARAMARMADPSGLAPGRAAAARALLDAMAAAPLMISGSTGFATALLRAAGATVRAKPGAEGVYCAALPGLGYGVALKIEDGAGRAAEVALGAILRQLGVLDDAAMQALAERLRPPIRNVAGAVVGELRAAESAMSHSVAGALAGMVRLATVVMKPKRRQVAHAMVCEALDPQIIVPTPAGALVFSCPTRRAALDPVNLLTDEPETLRWLDALPEGAVLWDIGAGVGVYALYGARVRRLQVVAFEPSAATYAVLCRNLHRNRLDDRVAAYCLALSDQTGLDRLYMADDGAGHSMHGFGQARTVAGPIPEPIIQAVPGFSIDRLMADFAPPPPQHVKLDVDGIEARIVAGGAATLRRHTRTILVEIDPSGGPAAGTAIRTALAGVGFAEDGAFTQPGDRRNVLFRRDDAG